jgi:hypothetical protein
MTKGNQMTPDVLSGFVAVAIVAVCLIAAFLAVGGVRRLARQPGVLGDGPHDASAARRIARVDRWLALLVTIWVAGALAGAFVLGGRSALVGLLYIVGLGLVAHGLVVSTETGRRLLAAAPQPWLIGMQTYRLIGGVFLIAATYDAVLAYFALPAGWGDLIVGMAAALIAIWWAAGARNARPAAWAWNIFGLLDLAIAVGIGSSLLAEPAAALFGGSPLWLERAALGFRPFASGIFPLSFPLALVPTFIVPLSIVLHLLSVQKLALGDAPEGRIRSTGTGATIRAHLASAGR